MQLTQKCSTALFRIIRPFIFSIAILLIFTPLVALADQPIIAKLDVNQSGRTMTGELHFDLGGGNLDGQVNLDVNANSESLPKRQSGDNTTGRFKVRIDLRGIYNGGSYGDMNGTAKISGIFIDDANCEATLDGIGTFNGSVSGPLGMAQAGVDWERVEYKGCNMMSPQPLSAVLPPFIFEKTDLIPTPPGVEPLGLGNVTGNVSTGNVSAGNATAGVPSPGANVTAPGGMNQTGLTAPGKPAIPTGTTTTLPGVPTGPVATTTIASVGNNQLGRASEVVSGQAVNQGITPAGSSNWYKFHASANGIISVNVENVPSDMRPDVSLYDKNFNRFVEKSATSPGDKLSFENDIPVPGWVYIVVSDADGKAHSEPYTLTVDFNAVQDSYDPNNVLGDAAEIKPGEAIKASICPHGELDWYKLHTDANGIISVDVENVPSDMRPDVQLYDKNFNRFEEKSATSPGGSLKFTRDIPAQGWVYVAISDADGKAHSEPYTLTVNFDAVQDSYDPNNVLGDAAEIKPGEAIKASICPHGEMDWYKLRADAGGIISVNVNAVPKDMRPGASLYDKNFNRFEDKQATNAADSLSFDKDLPAPGWAYIAVYDADGKAHSEPYTLTATLKSG